MKKTKNLQSKKEYDISESIMKALNEYEDFFKKRKKENIWNLMK
jgi:hypothetical protein